MHFDMTRPNTARVIDYWLGGNHNFEIDRQFGDQVAQAAPQIPAWQVQGRQMLERVVRYMIHTCHYPAIVDFGAGIPTCENTHLAARRVDPSVHILYNDIDPLTALYAREILEGIKGVAFVEGDASDPLPILESEEGRTLLNGERRIGILYMSLVHLMSDEQVVRAAHALYDWTAPGSCWFLTFPSPEWETNPEFAKVAEFYRKARVAYWKRDVEELIPLLSPWHVPSDSVSSNQQWGMPPGQGSPHARYSIEIMAQR